MKTYAVATTMLLYILKLDNNQSLHDLYTDWRNDIKCSKCKQEGEVYLKKTELAFFPKKVVSQTI